MRHARGEFSRRSLDNGSRRFSKELAFEIVKALIILETAEASCNCSKTLESACALRLEWRHCGG
jgi:hypothetical protein